LPAPVAHFIGRAEAQRALTQRLIDTGSDASSPLLVFVIEGTPGVGKTAFAVRWAHQVAERFPDGQLYIDLRGYDVERPVRPSEALAALLRSLGLSGPEIPERTEEMAVRYRTVLAGRRVLVVLDNAKESGQVRPLLPGSNGCAAVVTSRDAMSGLVARDGAIRLGLDLLSQDDAIKLLAALIGERVERDGEAAEILAEQCARLPLALRVAADIAARRPSDSLAELTKELSDRQRRLDLLDAGDDPGTSVRSVLSWSYSGLDRESARTFRLSGLHPGADFDANTIAALTNTTAERADHTLRHLLRAHLVQAAAQGRYVMHGLMSSYARELAAAEDGLEQCQAALKRLLDYVQTSRLAVDVVLPRDSGWRKELAATSADLALVRGGQVADRVARV
jgi:hypothetical protein